MVLIAYIFATLTAFILLLGVLSMALGGKINKKYSNKLMSLRVISQAFAILALFVLYLLYKSS
ncbi:MAG: HIG1 domain-containing protein [Rickettsiales bacterium]|nr:HIG1 domain-containing protein [Rickettsiales bacterium]MCA0254934.1 HIG1 domain-containing protein [Pseudomonadota bacterium]